MFVVVWEFQVTAGRAVAFEAAYGPSGEWVALFALDTSYRGTRLVRDVQRDGVYLTLDFWESDTAYDAFCRQHAREYGDIDTRCEGLTERETLLGRFSGQGMAEPGDKSAG